MEHPKTNDLQLLNAALADVTIAYSNIDSKCFLSDTAWIYGALNYTFQIADAPFNHWRVCFFTLVNNEVNFTVLSTDLEASPKEYLWNV